MRGLSGAFKILKQSHFLLPNEAKIARLRPRKFKFILQTAPSSFMKGMVKLCR